MYRVGSVISLWIVYLLNGSPQTGKTNLSIKIEDPNKDVVKTETLVEELNNPGKYSIDWNTAGLDDKTEYTVHFYEDASLIGAEAYQLDNSIVDTELLVNRIADIEEGNWKILGNHMIFYNRLGAEMFRFLLKNAAGAPSNTEVFSRTKV